ncbi:hypothetical protein B0O80DRAFT_446740 [Mortierella sp. GBAus27b]|nr:hypothetical protein B0O80DRAFT_446740 [Mortierella sp. GBAus27b]
MLPSPWTPLHPLLVFLLRILAKRAWTTPSRVEGRCRLLLHEKNAMSFVLPSRLFIGSPKQNREQTATLSCL